MRHNLFARNRTAPLVRPLWILSGVILLGTIVLGFTLSQKVAELEAQVQTQRRIVSSLHTQVAVADAKAAPLRQAHQIAEFLRQSAATPALLRTIEPLVPGDVWFIGASVSREVIAIDGRAMNTEEIASTAEALRRASEVSAVSVTSVARSDEGWYNFHLSVTPRLPRATPRRSCPPESGVGERCP